MGEPDALALYVGDGAVRLFAHDPETGAMLLEALRTGTPLFALTDRDETIDIACRLLTRLRRPVPHQHRFACTWTLAGAWADRLYKDYLSHAEPFEGELIEAATTWAHALAAAG